RAMERATGEALKPIRHDVARQLGGLVYPGFVAATGARRLGDVERYLRGAVARLERLPASAAVDLDRLRGVHELEAAYRARVESLPPGRGIPPELREVRWLLEELRMSHFAQSLGVRGPISSKRVRRALQEAAAAA
ncbi:MAG: ATP-dependent RNA helicase HrpA, partial [uncultured Solirubrobacteraceae bacterium]